MSVIPDPNKFYRSLLTLAALEVSEEGLVSEITDDGEKMPFFVNSKRLVIPESNQLRVSQGEERIFFQAARENIVVSETKEFAAVRKRVNDRMQIKIMAIMAELLVLAGSPKMHARLKGSQLELLRGLEEVSKSNGTFEAFKGLLAVTSSGDATQQPFSLYLHKNGKLGITGHSYRRVAVVSFPLYEQLVKDGQSREEIMARRKEQSKEHRDELPDNATFGVKLGKHNRAIFTRVLEFIFPLIATKDAYSMGSNSDYFPYLEAFCLGMQNVAECINNVIDLFVDVVPTLEGQRIDLSWVEAIANPDALYKAAQRVPDQNMGGAVGAQSQSAVHHGAIPIAAEVAVPPPVANTANPHALTPTQVGLASGVPVGGYPASQTTVIPGAAPAQTGHRIQEKTLSEIFGSPRQMPQGQQMYPGQQGIPGMYPQNPAFPIPQQQPQGRVYVGGGMPGMPGMQQPMPGMVQPGYPQQVCYGTTGAAPGVAVGQPYVPGFPNKSGI